MNDNVTETLEHQLKNLWRGRLTASLVVHQWSSTLWASERAIIHDKIRSIVQAIRRERAKPVAS